MGETQEGGLKEAFLRQALREIPSLVRHHSPQQALRRALSQELERHLAWRRDPEFAARFARHCPIPGAQPHDYLHRLVSPAPGQHLLAGIRFKGGDLGWPFIELLAWDHPLHPQDTLARALHHLQREFALFSPRAVRLLRDDMRPDSLQGGPWRLEEDLCYLAAPLDQLQRQERPSGLEQLRVAPARDLSFYPRYLASWQAFQRGQAPWRKEVTRTTEGDFEDCLRFGVVAQAWLGTRWLGLFAARRLTERYFKGYVVQDMMVDQALRGQGWAAALQRGALELLPASHGEWLYGTIHANNTPSLSTALRCGRRRTSTYVFLTPHGVAA